MAYFPAHQGSFEWQHNHLVKGCQKHPQPPAVPGPGLPSAGRKMEPCLVYPGIQALKTTAAFPFAGSTSSEAEQVPQKHTDEHAHTYTRRILTWLATYLLDCHKA